MKQITLLFLIVYSTSLIAKNWKWGAGYQFGQAFATTSDAIGNVYTAGHFSGKMIVGNDTLIDKGGYGVFAMCHDSSGALKWVISGTSSTISSFGNYAYAIDIDALGNTFVGGRFEGIFKIGNDSLVSFGGTDLL